VSFSAKPVAREAVERAVGMVRKLETVTDVAGIVGELS
jgi:hypothetical protein